ncbi:helix-turn-helix domain-containing protein [Stenotrophomonas sp. YIM B13575]|uniref:helix-turn-helix domain-containing protein n=1 Tax=Stenotrophomonas sp. YIM B13575 TaxID=3366314 RepID=UPI0036CCA631
MGGKGCNPAGGFHGSVECVHLARITYRDPLRNTNRVSATSQTVKNWPMAFSDNLRAARLRAGLTQEALALACGWSGQSRIANYESSADSAREPKVSEVPRLAKALGVSIASLFGEAPASQSQRPEPAILAETHRFLDKAFGTLGKAFDIEAEADLFADVYEWIVSDDRPAEQRNLVDFAAWREKRDLHRGRTTDEQNGSAAKQAGRAHKRSA